MASPTHMSRLMARILAKTWVESVRGSCRSLPPAAFFEQGQHGIEQHLLCFPLYQAHAKVRQNRKVKARVGQVPAEGIRELDPPAHRVGCLSIGQSLDELYYCNECKPRGAPQRGVHSGETHGQRTHPGKSFPRHRAFSCTDSLWDRRNAPHVPFLL